MPHVIRISIRGWRWLLPFLLLLILPALLWARAGGGEGFQGPSGGDGGGGDGGAMIYVIYLLIRLCIQVPIIGIPLLIIVIGFIVYAMATGKNQYQRSVITRGELAGAQVSEDALLSRMKNRDSGFDLKAFQSRASNAFLKVQQAWSKQDLSAIRPFVSDAVAERFALQFLEQKDGGYRNAMDNVNITDVRLAWVSTGSVFDALTVRITAQAVDYKVSLDTGKWLSGDRSADEFTEYWTFLRKTGVTTPAGSKPGLIEGNCPNCGAAITPDSAGGSAKCKACGALLKSGEFDWVLSKITQASVWHPGDSGGGKATVDAYRSLHDPGFSPEQIEDRASVIFWRMAKAERIGKIDPVRKVATAEFCSAYSAALLANSDAANSRRTCIANQAVGAVTLLGVIPAVNAADGGANADRAVIRVEWSGTRITVSTAPGKSPPHSSQGPGTYAVSIMTLARLPGIRSEAGSGMSSAHCPSCGAPQSDDAADVCSYCGLVLNDGKSNWVLMGMVLQQSAAATDLINELGRSAARVAQSPSAAPSGRPVTDQDQPLADPPPASVAGMLAWVAQVIVADGKVTPEEMSLLVGMCERQGLPTSTAKAMIDAARSGSSPAGVSAPADVHEAHRWLEQLALIVAEKGRVDDEDQLILTAAAERIGLSGWDAKSIAKRVKSQSLLRAREALAAQKSGRPRIT